MVVRSALVALLLACVAVQSAHAQIDSRFAAGGEFTIRATDHASGANPYYTAGKA